MPITFNEATNQFEGDNLFGETLVGFDFAEFGGIITNEGTIAGALTSTSSAGIEVSNTLDGVISSVAGSRFAVDLSGNGGRNFFNDGAINGDARFGNGWDSFFNSGTLNGRLELGSGNDLLTNQIIPGIDGGPETAGTITGTVDMGSGNDTVLNSGNLGDVRLGSGNDTYSVGGFAFGGDGPLTAAAGTSGDVLGNAGNDRITGGDTDERFYGGADNDTLSGGGGKDKLYGDSGDDQIDAGNGNDQAFGGTGHDTIDGGNNNDRLNGDSGDDVIFGGRGNDVASGGDDDDYLSGGQGNDRLSGGNGRDALEGGAGRDQLTGGANEDVFIFAGKTGRDTITDFEDGDRIDLLFPFGGGAVYADVIANTQFSGGNAVIDLSAVFNLSGADRVDNGSILTVNNVTLADLDEDAFAFISDIFIAV